MPDDEDPIIGDGEEDWFGDADPRVPDASGAGGAGGAGGGSARRWAGNELRFVDPDREPDLDLPGSYVPSALGESEAALRELERRLESNRTPAFPIDLRKRLPLEAVWRRWRALAMLGRSDVVDDFGRDPRATGRGSRGSCA